MLSGRVIHGTNPGPGPHEEETILMDLLILTAKPEYGKT